MGLLLKIAVVLLGLYLAAVGGLFAAMFQPPGQFAALVAQVPPQLMMVFPFKPLWHFARSGDLKVGDPAPDFHLQTFDKTSTLQLSSFRGQPVVLVFGSYT